MERRRTFRGKYEDDDDVRIKRRRKKIERGKR